MAWSISDVARATGTTSRTLRHYDDIGLLKPAFIGDNGYRYYGQDELLRLQQILLYRESGMPLADIREVLGGRLDPETALRGQLHRLRQEQRRLIAMERTILRTLDNLREHRIMKLEEIFEGFDPKQQAEWEQEIIGKYGDQARASIEEGYRKMASWTPEDAQGTMRLWQEALSDAASAMQQGAEPGDEASQGAIRKHIDFISQFWTPSREAYLGLGETYVNDERFPAQFEAVAPGLAAFFREAMTLYAEARLT